MFATTFRRKENGASLTGSRSVPNPKPAVFRITKTNHNILQGVAKANERFTADSQKMVDDWGTDNAKRFWTKDGCPLAPRSKGGADVIVVDDPQMPVLVSIAKSLDPDRPVVFRSHIQMRSDLIAHADSEAHAVWAWIWSHVQKADVFVAHPISKFVPAEVPRERVAYMPATTDWIDGLNKKLSDDSTRGYLDDFNAMCRKENRPLLEYPKRDYIVQVARFDPSKGFDDCLAAYAYFRYNSPFCKGKLSDQTPQLLLCGHSSVDDPDGSIIFKDILDSLDNDYSDLKDSVVVMRVGPSDQMLNTLLSCAHVALQLSTSEGFEVKVSEALHKGIPVIARSAGGLPLQIQHGKSGFLIEEENRDVEVEAVADHLQTLFADKQKYAEMSRYAASHISDEVGTVGNAICWMYLMDRLTGGGDLAAKERWVWDLAEEHVGSGSHAGGVRLPRNLTT
jgi:glycosyltransferase involved in cell wall biosynthesis